MNKQTQKGGNNSTNIQASEITIEQGLSYLDVRQIAIDVFKSNFYELAGVAKEIAAERAEQVTEKFLKKLQNENPKGFLQAQDPDFQYALFTVQKEYARTGDEDLGDILVGILIDRTAESSRNFFQIILDEALIVAPKLTMEQVDIITINFMLKRIILSNTSNYDKFISHINDDLCPFAENLTDELYNYNHIKYLGCGQYQDIGSSHHLASNIRKKYLTFFSKGFTEDEFQNKVGSVDKFRKYLTKHENNHGKLRFKAMNQEELKDISIKNNLPHEEIVKLRCYFEQTSMNPRESQQRLIEINPLMENIFSIWDKAYFKELELTSVGIVIAHANYRRKTGELAHLSAWVK